MNELTVTQKGPSARRVPNTREKNVGRKGRLAVDPGSGGVAYPTGGKQSFVYWCTEAWGWGDSS